MSRNSHSVPAGQLVVEPGSEILRIRGESIGYLIGPAFFDPQVNGFGGVDFQSPSITRDELEWAAAKLKDSGCAHILLTLISNTPDFLEQQLARLSEMVQRSETLKNTILGFHLEGPFLADKPGFSGVHQSQYLRDPDWALFRTWQRASGGAIRMVTLSPELPGSLDLIGKVRAEGVWVAAGHSDASLDELISAVDAGLQMATHLGNGCPPQMHRHDNITERFLSIPQLLASVIPDGIHIPPFVLSSYTRLLGAARLIMTTDAVAPAAAPYGSYSIGSRRVTVGEDRIVRFPGTDHFAGSSLTMIEGFYNAMRFGGVDAATAWLAWTRLRDMMFPEVDVPMIAVPFPRFSLQ